MLELVVVEEEVSTHLGSHLASKKKFIGGKEGRFLY